MANDRNDPLTAVAAQVVASDSVLRSRLRRLVANLITDAEHTLQFGLPRDKLALQRAIVPQLLKSLTAADAGAEEDERRALFERLMAETRGES